VKLMNRYGKNCSILVVSVSAELMGITVGGNCLQMPAKRGTRFF